MNVCNSVVFTWGFVEMLCWFWVSEVLSWRALGFGFQGGERLLTGG